MADFQKNLIEINRNFMEAERSIRIHNFRIACIIAAVFTLAGCTLDILVYPMHFQDFLKIRIVLASLLLFIWWLVKTPVGARFYRILGLLLPALPTVSLAIMIYRVGPDSPYYAGFNLVLLGAVIILRWTVVDTVLIVCEVLGLYLAAALLRGIGGPGEYGMNSEKIFYSNIFFVVVTGAFVVVGNYFYNQIRFREFAFRYELDKNKRELEETNRKLVEMDQLKSRFFANISHEMRTPLTLLLSPLETLMQRFEKSIDDNSRELLGTMHANGMRLLKLINDLLDLIRMEAGRMDIKSDPLLVPDFINGLASAVRQVAENKQIDFETQIDPRVTAILTDRDKLEKILLNLLFNALKFTPEGGKVWLRAARDGDQFILAVGDTGIGIAEKNLPFVFDRFWQADSSSRRKYAGVGIGLALVKELSEMMGGNVEVKSVETKGTTFTVRLPYYETKMPAREKAPLDLSDSNGSASEEWLAGLYRRAELFPTATPIRNTALPENSGGFGATVLVADDEPDMRRYLKSELDTDYNVLEAIDGVDALEKASQFHPDIILLDMMMPQMDGLDVCRELRKREATMDIPIILLTARADEETKFDALAIGANDFLAKPFSSTELRARIKNLIESHLYQRKLSKQNVALTSAIEQIKETEMQLVQSEKLASLGRMSAGIIHEINNPLNYTLTGLFALRNKGKQLPPQHRVEFNDILNDIEEGIKRVRNIVSDLRTFTHPGGGGGEMVEMEDALDAALRFLSGEWKGKVHIEKSLPAHLAVWANRNKLVHVLVNLLQNSMDALSDKKFDGPEERTIWIEGHARGERNAIVVRDNGPGIVPQVLDKIFDPFFTTKDVGKGMGLGLSICYRILQGYGGSISVKSEPGKNCEFTIELPSREKTAEEETQDEQLLRL
jgi:signal transduction histidine kinase